MKSALITGIGGQDGLYLAKFLKEKGYCVYGTVRPSSISILHIPYEIYPLDLSDSLSLTRLISRLKPTEIYNLAAVFTNGQSNYPCPEHNFNVNGLGVITILEAIKEYSPKTRLFQAGTSYVFGNSSISPQNEITPFCPHSPYAVAKLYAHWSVINYREAYGLYACNGILFNHESPRRGYHFLTRKITRGVARIKMGYQEKLTLGNLNVVKDWGFVKDFVEGMWLMLQQEAPEDFVLAAQRLTSIRRFVEITFSLIGIQIIWEGQDLQEKGIDEKTGKIYVDVSQQFYRSIEQKAIVGNAEKAQTKLGWISKTSLEDLIKLMLDAELNDLENCPNNSFGTL